MPRPTALAALAALLLTAGCSAAHSHPPVSAQSSRPGPVSIAPAGATPTQPSTTRPSTTRPSSTAPTSTAPASSSAVPASSSAAPARPSSTATPGTATALVVRRPVTAQGRVAAGYTVVSDRFGDSACGGTGAGASRQSPVAVDAGPVACGPSAVYAVACWNAPTGHAALCFRDPWQRQVVRLATAGPLVAVAPPAKPSPLGLVLSNGVRCTLRAGGAWNALDGHPDMFGTFGCTDRSVIWGTDHSDGIDRTSTLWKAWLAPGSGHGKLHSMTVRTAYFVGTARS